MDRRTFLLGATASTVGLKLQASSFKLEAWSLQRPRPTSAQLAWQRDELALFLHFGVNTFTDREWGDGKESPAIFNPERLDAAQWARTAKAGGFKAIVLTAKHHDGFCLWPTATTKHSVASSPWRGGTGDVVREFVDACRAEGLRPGLYLSPWDRNHPTYGDSPKYMDVYIAQLTELCTRYGPLAEVWFDGANGEGPNGKRQVYDWPRIWGTVRRLQPEAVMFSDAGPDVRWCGNEIGSAGDPNWSTVDPKKVPHPGADGPGIIAALQHGDADGTVWRPAEVDVSIRPGWFYHAAQNDKVRSVQNLVDLYCSSVGRNSKLLLNVPPTPSGLIHETDAARLADFNAARTELFGIGLGEAFEQRATLGGPRAAIIDLDLGRTHPISAVRLAEDIEQGQVVSRYTLEGLGAEGWGILSTGTTIGYAKIDRFPTANVSRFRLAVTTVDEPQRVRITAYSSER
jgi:alpha-L-fucosidase